MHVEDELAALAGAGATVLVAAMIRRAERLPRASVLRGRPISRIVVAVASSRGSPAGGISAFVP